jgi:hypothetical protein
MKTIMIVFSEKSTVNQQVAGAPAGQWQIVAELITLARGHVRQRRQRAFCLPGLACLTALPCPNWAINLQFGLHYVSRNWRNAAAVWSNGKVGTHRGT